jgi:hypothetical protein
VAVLISDLIHVSDFIHVNADGGFFATRASAAMFSFNFSADDGQQAAPLANGLLDARELSFDEMADTPEFAIEEVRACDCEPVAGSSGCASARSATALMRREATGVEAAGPCPTCGLAPLRKHVIPESWIPEMLATGEAAGCGPRESLRESLRASDLVRGGYEGGFKLWECAIDLLHEIWRRQRDGTMPMRQASVLEAGCGAGLPSLLALRLGCRLAVLHDFNAEVRPSGG